MRLIDADLLKEKCKITGEFMNNFQCVDLVTLGSVIDAQPAVYNQNKVVAELEKLADKANDKILEAGELQQYYDGYEDGVRTAIELVKGGGVDPGYKHPAIAKILTCNEAVMWEEYKKIGTPEECRSAVEKQIAETPDFEGDGYSDGHIVYDTWICPGCGADYEVDCERYEYCPKCGQKISWASWDDWEDEEDEEENT